MHVVRLSRAELPMGSAGNRAGQSGWTKTDLPTELGPAAATKASRARRGNAAWPRNSTGWDWVLPSEPTGKGLDPALLCQQGRETRKPQALLQIPPHQQRKYQPAPQTHTTLCESRLWLGEEKKIKSCAGNKRAAPALPRVVHCALNYTFTLVSGIFINHFSSVSQFTEDEFLSLA